MEQKAKRLDIGMYVRYVTADRQWVDALVTCIHGEVREYTKDQFSPGNPATSGVSYPAINLVYVSPDDGRKDQYGRQIEHKTSISHWGQYVASGYFWCHKEDEEAAFKQLTEALAHIKS